MLRRALLCSLTICLGNWHSGVASAAQPSNYGLVKRYLIGGSDTGYDYVRIDSATRQVFIAHGNRVEVLDADSGKKLGEITGMHGVHGIELIPGLNIGFTSNGLDRSVTQFDLKTLQPLKTTQNLGIKPDAIQYDLDTQKLYVVNGGATGDVTVIEPKSGEIVGTVALGGGKLEQIAFDGSGRAFVNDEKRNVVHVFDTHTLKPIAVWPIAPGEEPTGMAIDNEHHRLFSVGANNKMVVLDTNSGHVVATPTIGSDPDGVAFDASTGRIFTSNRDGTLTILHEDTPDRYALLQTVRTEPGARTLALDAKTGRVFLPTAKTQADGKTILPDTFVVLVVGQ